MPDRVRSIASGDLELICEHREHLFVASGHDWASLKPMIDAFRGWLRPRLADKTYFGWIIERDGRAARFTNASIGCRPPRWDCPSPRRRQSTRARRVRIKFPYANVQIPQILS